MHVDTHGNPIYHDASPESYEPFRLSNGMSTEQLKKFAELAYQGEWKYSPVAWGEFGEPPVAPASVSYELNGVPPYLQPATVHLTSMEIDIADAEYIHAAQPAHVKELIQEIERLQKLVREQEKK